MRKVCILGVSGSIGTQTIDVMNKNPNDFSLVGFSLGSRTRKITPLIKQFPNIRYICVGKKEAAKRYQKKYPDITFYYGDEGLLSLIDNCGSDMVVNALVGFVGLKPTIHALKKNLIVCLANKEALVVGGQLVNELLDKGYGKLYPIDSEHVAISKCLSVDPDNVLKIVLTASGGAFRKLNREQLKDVTPEDALKHPNWKMGKKITIDCATMVNKSFEIIEAHYLFRYPIEKIGVMLHDESMIHSYVIYKDGSLRLDEGKPDMRIPIKYALYETLTDFKTVVANSLDAFKKYHFHNFDIKRYPMVKYASVVINNKGTYGAVFNAANEVANYAFLNHEIDFLTIEKIIEALMDSHKNNPHPTLEEIIQADKDTRKLARQLVAEWRKK
ncbi:MAG: 1-deoxy-D-xylulose-5-phosphate reductoisomerase [Bacilli bacterium]|nr:1-deoxy-D-xylulose-5-phosphate reductoisomerase [Bacilli bacterium]